MIVTALGLSSVGSALAEPEVDDLAKLNELTKQAQQLIETAQSVQLDLEKKVQLQADAERKHADDVAVLESTQAQLADYQGTVDKAAAAFYAGGRTDSVSAFFTAASPQRLIDELAFQRAITDQMSGQLKTFRNAKQRAEVAAAASAESAATAKEAADAAAAVRADLEKKSSRRSRARSGWSGRPITRCRPPSRLSWARAVRSPTVGMSGLVPPTPAPSPRTSSRPSPVCSPSVACAQTPFPITRAATPSTS